MISKFANDVADSLRTFNCTLALDDFGAGYSSLARLRQLPFTRTQDRPQLRRDCDMDRFNAGLCETIVEPRRFGLKTVAEGSDDPREPQAARHRLRGRAGPFAEPSRKASSSA